MNPYQKIVIDGKEIQKGHIDTTAKFKQLTDGIDFEGKRVLDVGCNLGMMCQLSYNKGAGYVQGVDVNRDYIEQARSLFPDIDFNCREAYSIVGNWDIIICSAMFHYITDPDRFLKQLSRCGKMVLMDVWFRKDDHRTPLMELSERGLWIPNQTAFMEMAGRYFNVGRIGELCETPDGSTRHIVRLSKPRPNKPKAVLISGKGGMGKTTLAVTYFGYQHYQIDQAFIDWRIVHQNTIMSVDWHYNACLYGDKEYHRYILSRVKKWIGMKQNLDLVIEGRDLCSDDFVNEVKEYLQGYEIKTIKL